MKRKLNRLRGKRLVTGDVNLLTKNEILINDTSDGVEVKGWVNGEIKDLAGSSSFICVGLKNPFFLGDEDISELNAIMLDMSTGQKYTGGSYNYANMSYEAYEGSIVVEQIIALIIPTIPEFPFNVFGSPTSVYDFQQLRLVLVSWGYTEQEFDSYFYELSKEEFFTPSTEIIDRLTLEFDNHKLLVNFATNAYIRDGVMSKITDNYIPSFSDLNSATYGKLVCSNVKYKTTTNNYVEIYNRFSSDVVYSGRVKVNGTGPDPDYGNVTKADGFRHSSGIIVAVIE